MSLRSTFQPRRIIKKLNTTFHHILEASTPREWTVGTTREAHVQFVHYFTNHHVKPDLHEELHVVQQVVVSPPMQIAAGTCQVRLPRLQCWVGGLHLLLG